MSLDASKNSWTSDEEKLLKTIEHCALHYLIPRLQDSRNVDHIIRWKPDWKEHYTLLCVYLLAAPHFVPVMLTAQNTAHTGIPT